MIRRLATENRIPLWDFDLAAETVPGRGLQPDGLHLKEGGTNDYTFRDRSTSSARSRICRLS